MFKVQFIWIYISRPGETQGRTHGHPCLHPAPRYTSEPPPSANILICNQTVMSCHVMTSRSGLFEDRY